MDKIFFVVIVSSDDDEAIGLISLADVLRQLSLVDAAAAAVVEML